MFTMYQWYVAQQWREQSSYQRTWPASSYTTPPPVSGRACRTCRGVGGAMRCSSTTVDWLSLVESRLTVGWWETLRSLTGNGGLTQGATWGSQGRASFSRCQPPDSQSVTYLVLKPLATGKQTVSQKSSNSPQLLSTTFSFFWPKQFPGIDRTSRLKGK